MYPLTKQSCLLTRLLTVNLIMRLKYGMFAGITLIYKICKFLHRTLQVVYDELFELNNNLSVYQRDHRYLAIEVFNSILYLNPEFIEAVVQRCSVKKVFFKILQNSQEKHLCLCLRPATLLKSRLWHRCLPVNFVKFLRTPFL